jgi:hypothetical protein
LHPRPAQDLASAQDNGWTQNPNSSVERWGEFKANGDFSWRVLIKMEGSARPGLAPGSWVPRFSARLGDQGEYVNPFTVELGTSRIGTHIPLEDPWGEVPPIEPVP